MSAWQPWDVVAVRRADAVRAVRRAVVVRAVRRAGVVRGGPQESGVVPAGRRGSGVVQGVRRGLSVARAGRRVPASEAQDARQVASPLSKPSWERGQRGARRGWPVFCPLKWVF